MSNKVWGEEYDEICEREGHMVWHFGQYQWYCGTCGKYLEQEIKQKLLVFRDGRFCKPKDAPHITAQQSRSPPPLNLCNGSLPSPSSSQVGIDVLHDQLSGQGAVNKVQHYPNVCQGVEQPQNVCQGVQQPGNGSHGGHQQDGRQIPDQHHVLNNQVALESQERDGTGRHGHYHTDGLYPQTQEEVVAQC